MGKKNKQEGAFGGGARPDLEAMMREYGNDVLRTAYLYVGDRQLAEDLFQEVFLRVYQSYGTFRGESSVKTWLLRITINAAKDCLKSAWRRRVTALSELPEPEHLAEDVYERVEREADGRTIREAVLALPQHYREVVVCVFYQELSVQETARLLHLPTGTVKSRLSRAKEQLRRTLKGGDDIDR